MLVASTRDRSVSDTARLFLMARNIERADHERREQEGAKREGDRKRELGGRYRLAKEEMAAKFADVSTKVFTFCQFGSSFFLQLVLTHFCQ